MCFNRLLSFYSCIVRATEEPPNLWGCSDGQWRLSPGSMALPFRSQKKATMAEEYPGQARIHAAARPGIKSLLHSTATSSFSWKFPWSVKIQKKKLIYPRKKEALQILVNEWDLSEEELVDIFLTVFSTWEFILDMIQIFHGNILIFRKCHCKRNIELKHFSEIKTFEWRKLTL